MRGDIVTQRFPVVVQRLAGNAIEILFIGIDRQNAFSVGGFVEPRAGTLLFRQLVGGFQQPVLNRFEGLCVRLLALPSE